MYRDGTGRTLVDILFSRRREVDGFPWLRGGEEIAVPAKRNGRTGKGNRWLRAILTESAKAAAGERAILPASTTGSLLAGARTKRQSP